MRRFTRVDGTHIWVNPDHVRSVVDGGVFDEPEYRGPSSQNKPQTRIRWAYGDGETIVRGELDRVAALLRAPSGSVWTEKP